MQLDQGIVQAISNNFRGLIPALNAHITECETLEAKYEQMVIDDKIHHDQIIALKNDLTRALSGSPDYAPMLLEDKEKDAKIASLEIENAGYCAQVKALKKGMKMMERFVELFRTKKKIKHHKHWNISKCIKDSLPEKV